MLQSLWGRYRWHVIVFTVVQTVISVLMTYVFRPTSIDVRTTTVSVHPTEFIVLDRREYETCDVPGLVWCRQVSNLTVEAEWGNILGNYRKLHTKCRTRDQVRCCNECDTNSIPEFSLGALYDNVAVEEFYKTLWARGMNSPDDVFAKLTIFDLMTWDRVIGIEKVENPAVVEYSLGLLQFGWERYVSGRHAAEESNYTYVGSEDPI